MAIIGLMLWSIIVILVSILWKIILSITWKPYYITRKLQKQGIKGPKIKFLSGSLDEIKSLKKESWSTELDINSHDIIPKVHPHYYRWVNLYGETFVYGNGSAPRLCITNAEQAKQILITKFSSFPKPKPSGDELGLLGRGLVFAEGSEWTRHRKVVGPAFTMDKLKFMTKAMAECTKSVLEAWRNKVTQTDKEDNLIEVKKQFTELTADILTHAAFGSSYLEGKEAFSAQKELQNMVIESFVSVQIPGFKYVPTKKNIRRWMLDRKVKKTLTDVINNRMKSKNSEHGKDLLGLMMESTQKQDGIKLDTNEIIDECKTFFFAGQDTTSQLLTWVMFLLSTNLDWQEKLREEVLSVCGKETPIPENLPEFKLMNMFLLETLRLYSPLPLILREAGHDVELGGIIIPKGTELSIPVLVLHRRKELWGEDADKFEPLRFKNGVANACTHPNALLTFSTGPRVCLGQNFTMIEGKMVLAMILQRFSFTISKDYKHMPEDLLTVQPRDGLPILFKALVA